MPQESETELHEYLHGALKGSYTGFSARLRQLPYEWRDRELDLSGKFFYLPFGADGEHSLSHFAQCIYWNIMPFCLPRHIRAEFDRKYEESRDPRYLHEPTDAARDLFVRAIKSRKTTGEPGELILFMLLEGILGAPQIACKMYLKTSMNVPVHGADSIHVLNPSDAGGTLRLIWGESKVEVSLSGALDSICESLSKFLTPTGDGTPRDREIAIIKGHLDVEVGPAREALLRYFDPYEEASNNLAESVACFAAFNYDAASELAGLSGEAREARFTDIYTERAKSAIRLFRQKVVDAELNGLSFYFFLLPFPSVAKLREQFYRQLRISDD